MMKKMLIFIQGLQFSYGVRSFNGFTLHYTWKMIESHFVVKKPLRITTNSPKVK
jgi:hypothetical protein